MTDIYDQATAVEEMWNKIALDDARFCNPLPPIEKCYNCQDCVPEGLRFCDKDCRDDFEKRNRLKMHNIAAECED